MSLSELEHDSFEEKPTERKPVVNDKEKTKMLENPWHNKAILDKDKRNIAETKQAMREDWDGKEWNVFENPAIWVGDIDE